MARSGSSCLPSAGTSRTASGREADVGESSAVSAPKTPRCPGVGSAPYRRRWDRGKPAGARPGTTTGRRAHGRPAPFEAPEAAHRPGVQRHVQQGGRSRRTARRPPSGCCAPASRVASVPDRSPAAAMASARSSGPGASRATAATSRPATTLASSAISVTSTTSTAVARIRSSSATRDARRRPSGRGPRRTTMATKAILCRDAVVHAGPWPR
jgi:hypothetical protein